MDDTAKPDMTKLARYGAQLRLAAIDTEIKMLHALFPDLTAPSDTNGHSSDHLHAITTMHSEKPHTMSKANRLAVSRRMRAYWRKRRAEKRAKARV